MKKGLLRTLLSALVIGLFATSAMAKSYPDVPKTHWAYKQITALTAENVLVGYPDGKFKPAETATRAEFAAMVIKALHQDKAPLRKTFEFKDVPYKHWAFNVVQRAINLDLLANNEENMFRPEDTIIKKEAMEIMVSALNLNKLGLYNAQKAIGAMSNPESPITRAEMAFGLYNMQQEARVHPNRALEDLMKTNRSKGHVIRGIKIDGTVATIPKGATIPVLLLTDLNSHKNEISDKFLTNVNKAIITKHGYVVIAEQSKISGEITDIKFGRLFVRNGKMGLETTTINTAELGQTAPFEGTIASALTHKNWFEKIVRAIIKGANVKLQSGKVVRIKLTEPIKVDLASGWITK
jgi:hypothetical protein